MTCTSMGASVVTLMGKPKIVGGVPCGCGKKSQRSVGQTGLKSRSPASQNTPLDALIYKYRCGMNIAINLVPVLLSLSPKFLGTGTSSTAHDLISLEMN
jgi:hypothetical protein